MDLSVIIPTYNRAAAIERLVAHLFKQTIDRRRTEIIIVNDGSNEETSSVLAKSVRDIPWITIIHQKNRGAAAARQRGAELARAATILFLDDDMEPADPFFLEKHRRFHLGSREEVVALGAILPPPEDRIRPAFEYFYERSLARLYKSFSLGERPVDGRSFFSANVSLPSRLFWSVNGFDASYAHAEDRELGLRLTYLAKAQFAFLKQAAAYHHSAKSPYHSFQRRAFFYGYYDKKMSELYPNCPEINPTFLQTKLHPVKHVSRILAERAPQMEHLLNKLVPMAAELSAKFLSRNMAAHLCSLLYTFHYTKGLLQATQEQKVAPLPSDERHSHAS